jgi:hypothetical protein
MGSDFFLFCLAPHNYDPRDSIVCYAMVAVKGILLQQQLTQTCVFAVVWGGVWQARHGVPRSVGCQEAHSERP